MTIVYDLLMAYIAVLPAALFCACALFHGGYKRRTNG